MSDLLTNLKKRRADWTDRLDENRKAMADAMQAVLVDEAHLQEIDFAIEALSIVPAPAPAAPPEKPKRAYKRRTPSRAAARPAETDALTDRSSQRTLETATPTNDGAGTESVDDVERDRPEALRRTKAAAE